MSDARCRMGAMMAAILAREQAAATARPNASSAAENSSSAVTRRLHRKHYMRRTVDL